MDFSTLYENKEGIMYFGGCNTEELAERYGTPLYVYNEQRIREKYRILKRAFEKNYPKIKIFYAIKANNNTNIIRILKSEGAGADASRPAEIRLALDAGLGPKQIMYSGNNHSLDELKFGFEKNVILNLDDFSQIEKLKRIGIPDLLSFRLNPGVGKGKFKQLIFAGPEAKFGIREEDIGRAYAIAKDMGIKRFGIHMMTGSCVLDSNYFEQITLKMMNVVAKTSKELGIDFEFIDIGGSLGVPYKEDEEELDIDKVAKGVCDVMKDSIKENNLSEPTLFLEPGRFLVGDAGILLARVNSIKESYKKFIGVDAAMNDLIRPAFYGAYHKIVVANNLNAKPEEKVNIVGSICENSDQFAKERRFPKVKEGSLLAMMTVGAYGYGMSSNYNTRARPAEVLVNNGKSYLIRNRESFEDLCSKIVELDRLK